MAREREIQTLEDFIDLFSKRGESRTQIQQTVDLMSSQIDMMKAQLTDDQTKDRAIPPLLYGLAARNFSEEGMRFADALMVHIGKGNDIKTFLEENPEFEGLDMQKAFGNGSDIQASLAPLSVSELAALPANTSTDSVSLDNGGTKRRGRPAKASAEISTTFAKTFEELSDKYKAIRKLFEKDSYWVEEDGKRWTLQKNLAAVLTSSKGKELSDSSIYVYAGQIFEKLGIGSTKLHDFGKNKFYSESEAKEILLGMEKGFNNGALSKNLKITDKTVIFEKAPGKKK